MTEQEIFDTVTKHLSGMKKQSLRAGMFYELCAYRDLEGNKCAVGCLITDDEYTPEMDETGDVSALCEEGLLPERLIPHIDLLSSLQDVHDREVNWVDNREGMVFDLKEIASEYKLDSSVVDQYFESHSTDGE